MNTFDVFTQCGNCKGCRDIWCTEETTGNLYIDTLIKEFEAKGNCSRCGACEWMIRIEISQPETIIVEAEG